MHQRLLERPRNSSAIALLNVLAIGCLDAPAPASFYGETQQAVVGGYTANDNHSVVYLPGCSGTLIAPNLVLTALHCVAPITGDDNFTCTAKGELENPPNGQLGAHRDPNEVTITLGSQFSNNVDARGIKIISTQSTQICQNDLAFVILDRDLEQPISPVSLERLVSKGDMMTVVGYGLTANPEDLLAGEMVARRRRDGIRVVAVGSTSVAPEGGDALPRTFALGESVCKGDSGGPAFTEEGAIAGVYSTFVGGCTGAGARNFYTMLSEFKPLVMQAYREAEATPWLAGQSAPGQPISPPNADAGTPGPTGDLNPASQDAIGSGYCSGSSYGARSTPSAWLWFAGAFLLMTMRRRRLVD